MSKKTLIIISSVVVIIILFIFLLPYFMKVKTGQNLTVSQSLQIIFPFGKPSVATNPGDNTGTSNGNLDQNTSSQNSSSENTSNIGEPLIPRLRHITTTPTAGDVVVERDKSITIGKITKKIKEFFVRYIYRGNGHIEEIKTSSFDVTKVSNTTIPKVYEAMFTPNGEGFIARFLGDNLDDIKTYSASLRPIVLNVTNATSTNTVAGAASTAVVASSTSNSFTNIRPIGEEANLEEVVGKYLDLNIREIAYSPNRTNILSLFTSADGGDIVFSNSNGDNKKTLYSSALREWLLSFPTETTAVISTKPSGTAYGVAYKLDTKTGAMSKIVGGLPGLTVLPSRNLTYTLLGLGNDTMRTNIVKTDDPSTYLQIINTIPEKCIWSKVDNDTVFCAVPKSIPSALYPDDWYKGNVSFSDDIWEINVKTGFSNLVVSPSATVGEDIDAINLDISPTDNYLTFINKNDLTLWGYDVTNEANIKIDLNPPTITATSTAPTIATSTASSTKK